MLPSPHGEFLQRAERDDYPIGLRSASCEIRGIVLGLSWEGRYKSIGVTDQESLLATAAYIDLNPVAAGISPTPLESPHTSLRARITHCQANGTAETLHDDLSTLSRNPRGSGTMALADRR